jgi:hypothetical protein
VRDGQGADADPLKNDTYWFELARPDGDGGGGVTLAATLRYRRQLGVQFKCFVDHPGLSSEHVSELLASENQLASPTSAGDRTWFLLRSYPFVDAGGGLQNNFRFPVLMRKAGRGPNCEWLARRWRHTRALYWGPLKSDGRADDAYDR